MRRRYLFRAVVARAQQAVMPVIGLLSGGSPEPFAAASAGFEHGLNEAGFIPGRNVAIEYRWAHGQSDRLPGLAADLVSRQVALIATATLPGALAAKAASKTIPIVFVIGEEPVQVGLVASLNRPGGNITGVSNFMNLLAPKRLELLAETVPKATVLALLVNAKNPNAEPDTRDLQAAAHALGRGLQVLTASTDQELEIC
jgi:putative tryptophan/tyrosine transport system substrate-binding protein